MKPLIFLFAFALIFCGFKLTKNGPIDDAQIVAGSGNCNKSWTPVDIKNASTTSYLTVTIKVTETRNGKSSESTQVFSRLAPQEKRQLGCKGCGNTTTGQQCTGFVVAAAVYE